MPPSFYSGNPNQSLAAVPIELPPQASGKLAFYVDAVRGVRVCMSIAVFQCLLLHFNVLIAVFQCVDRCISMLIAVFQC